MTPASIGLLDDYNSRQPGLCHFGSFSSSPGLPPRGYRCKAIPTSGPALGLLLLGTNRTTSYEKWELFYTDVSHEPESGGAPEASGSKCEIRTYDVFKSEEECNALGMKGRSSSVECYLNGKSKEGARLCKEGASESKWLVWGLLSYSVLSLCVASCGIFACCWTVWSDCFCPHFSLVAFVKGMIWKTCGDEDDPSEAEDAEDAVEKGETNQDATSSDDEAEEVLFNNTTNDVNATNDVMNDPNSSAPTVVRAVTLPGAVNGSSTEFVGVACTAA